MKISRRKNSRQEKRGVRREISIGPKVFTRLHPKLEIIFFSVEQADNRSKAQESAHLLKEVEKAIRLTFHKESIKSHLLIAPWSVAQQEFGEEAKHYQTSVEHLIKDVLQGKNLETQTAITNLVRYISLKYLIPLAVDDWKKINGNLQFDVVSGRKKTDSLHRWNVHYKLKKGDVYYHDDNQVLGAKLDFWKNVQTLPTPETNEALIHLEILPPIQKEMEKRIVEEMTSLIETFCKGKVKVYTLNKRKRSAVIS